jgi:rSAM/selenodomain-associated transferase 1
MSSQNALIIFIKTPITNFVKTRLLSHLKGWEVSKLYSAFLKDIDLIHHDLENYDSWYAIAPENFNGHMLSQLIRLENHYFQSGSSLGERMNKAFERTFNHGYRKVALIGSDIPDLSPSLVIEAFDKLNAFDCVIGPSADGGYYLIALNQPHPGIFNKITWGTDRVLQETIERCKQTQISVYQLKQLFDIDTVVELKAYYQELKQTQRDRDNFPINTWNELTKIANKL